MSEQQDLEAWRDALQKELVITRQKTEARRAALAPLDSERDRLVRVLSMLEAGLVSLGASIDELTDELRSVQLDAEAAKSHLAELSVARPR